jgi:hypothetical protein
MIHSGSRIGDSIRFLEKQGSYGPDELVERLAPCAGNEFGPEVDTAIQGVYRA